jgi:hypothetical protein
MAQATVYDLTDEALNAIERNEFFCLELAAQSAVDFDEVSHFGWFRRAVMRYLIDNAPQFSHLNHELLM